MTILSGNILSRLRKIKHVSLSSVSYFYPEEHGRERITPELCAMPPTGLTPEILILISIIPPRMQHLPKHAICWQTPEFHWADLIAKSPVINSRMVSTVSFYPLSTRPSDSAQWNSGVCQHIACFGRCCRYFGGMIEMSINIYRVTTGAAWRTVPGLSAPAWLPGIRVPITDQSKRA